MLLEKDTHVIDVIFEYAKDCIFTEQKINNIFDKISTNTHRNQYWSYRVEKTMQSFMSICSLLFEENTINTSRAKALPLNTYRFILDIFSYHIEDLKEYTCVTENNDVIYINNWIIEQLYFLKNNIITELEKHNRPIPDVRLFNRDFTSFIDETRTYWSTYIVDIIAPSLVGETVFMFKKDNMYYFVTKNSIRGFPYVPILTNMMHTGEYPQTVPSDAVLIHKAVVPRTNWDRIECAFDVFDTTNSIKYEDVASMIEED